MPVFIVICKLLAFLNRADRAGTDTCKAGNACICIALRLAFIIKCQSADGANTCAGAAADAGFLINYYCHYVLPPLRSNYNTAVLRLSMK